MGPVRPFGVIVKKGGARPRDEGGHYMLYDTLDDFFKDWTYLIRRGGSYKVADNPTFEGAVKSMFKVGGANYNYAALSYEKYLDGMLERHVAINNVNNNALDKLDEDYLKGDVKMSVTAKQVLDLTQSYVGANETSSKFQKVINVYNAHKPLARGTRMMTYWDWCAVFVSFVFIKLKATGLSGTEMSVGFFRDDHFKPKGIWIGRTNNPQPGDIITWDWDGNDWPDHIGFVKSVSNGNITTVEGNSNEAVRNNTFKVSDSRIYGYARPKYTTSTVTQPTKSIVEVAQEVLSGLWGNGNDRMTRLTNAGYDSSAVQAKVNDLVGGTIEEPKPVLKSLEEVAKKLLLASTGITPNAPKRLKQQDIMRNKFKQRLTSYYRR